MERRHFTYDIASTHLYTLYIHHSHHPRKKRRKRKSISSSICILIVSQEEEQEEEEDWLFSFLLLLLHPTHTLKMHPGMAYLSPLLLTLIFSNVFISGVFSAARFTIVNKCEYPVWPGVLSNAGIAPLSTTGFILQKGEAKTISAPSSWGGRFWGRTRCNQDSSDGKFSCLTGDCGSGKVECSGSGAAPPATLAEFTLKGHDGMDFYDVSLVDGYNLPMLVAPQGGSGVNCTSTGCVADLNGVCPSELRVTGAGGEGVACKSACEAFGQDKYCCSGTYNSPESCKPSSYSQVFKSGCPSAYSYAYDDKTSTFTCSGADYVITFCPSPNTSQKSSSGGQTTSYAGNAPSSDGMMVYQGPLDVSSATSTCIVDMFGLQAMAGAATVLIAVWRLY